jgi:hypothetical protein
LSALPPGLARTVRRRLLSARRQDRGSMRTATELARDLAPYEPRATELLEQARQLEAKAAALLTEALHLISPNRSTP